MDTVFSLSTPRFWLVVRQCPLVEKKENSMSDVQIFRVNFFSLFCRKCLKWNT